jgi:RNA polymerase sigma factor (sigma-70 family)
MSTRVVIADDHPIFRLGLEHVVSRNADLLVVGRTSCGAETLRLLEQERPDVAVVALELPRVDGIALLAEAAARELATRIVVLAQADDERAVRRALDQGAHAVVLRDVAVDELTDAIEAAACGRFYVSGALTHHLVQRRRRDSFSDALSRLTPSERRVLSMLTEHLTSPQIAERLGISPRTVQNHRANICDKLELRGQNRLLAFALENKGRLELPL